LQDSPLEFAVKPKETMENIENFAGYSRKRDRLGMSNMELSLPRGRPKLSAMATEKIHGLEMRRAEPEKVDEAFSLLQEYFTVIGVVLREDRKAFIEEYFGDGKGFWTARVADDLAGCIGLRRLRLSVPPDGHIMDCAEIKRMYVREKFRGQGIARRLLETAEQFANDTGYSWIYLDTTNEMKAAAKLYQRNGFVPCERYNQNPQAAIFMRKKLKPGV
jgi:GNAT superfamily N-acetyltransferase